MASSGAKIIPKAAQAGRPPSDGVAANVWSDNGGARLISKVSTPSHGVGAATKKTSSNSSSSSSRKSFNAFLAMTGDANSRVGPALRMDAKARGKFLPLVGFFERHRAQVQKREAIWKVCLKGKVTPKAETLDLWSNEILQKARDYSPGCMGIEIIMDGAKEEFEVVFDGPVLVVIGETIHGCKITESVSVHPDFSAFNGKWARNPGWEPAEIADCAFAYIDVHVVAAYTCKDTIAAIIEGNPVKLTGKRAGVATVVDGNDVVPLWQIIQDPQACFKCGARGHISYKCPWDQKGAQRKGAKPRFFMTNTVEWADGERVGKRNTSTQIAVKADEAVQHEVLPEATSDEEEPWNYDEIEAEARRRKDLQTQHRRQQEAKTKELQAVVRWEPEVDTPQGVIEHKASVIAEASLALADEGTSITRNQAYRSLKHTQAVKRAHKSVREDEMVVLECGGEGHCGPLSMLAALAALNGDLNQVNVEKIRSMAKKGKEKRDEWWTGSHFGRASTALQQPVALIEDAPTCWKTAIEVTMPVGDMDKKPIFVIGGSTKTGHFRAVVRAKKEDAERVEEYINQVFSNTTGLEDFAKVKAVGTLHEVWARAGVAVDKIPEELEHVKIGNVDLTGEGSGSGLPAGAGENGGDETRFGDETGDNKMQQ